MRALVAVILLGICGCGAQVTPELRAACGGSDAEIEAALEIIESLKAEGASAAEFYAIIPTVCDAEIPADRPRCQDCLVAVGRAVY